MKKTIGFVGTGNMGKAMLRGLVKAELYPASEIFIYNRSVEPMEALVAELGVTTTASAAELAQKAQVIILGVKPNALPSVLSQLKDQLNPEQLVVSVAAGVTLAQMAELLSSEQKLVRVMPNTPALVGEGMSAVAVNEQVTAAETAQILQIFQSFGKAELVTENLIDAVVGVSGSAPAYVYLFIEALADGAVAEGMPRAQAYEFAAQTVLGSAKMVLETGQHPGALKDMVSSPGGTTIAAVKVLEDKGFRSAVINAVQTAAQKNQEMSK